MKTLLLALLLHATLAAQPDRFGAPACAGPDRELADRAFYLLCHSSNLKVPLWAAEELTPARLTHTARRPSHFRSDNALASPGAANADYTAGGFHRGHLVPAADFAFSDSAIRSTFLLSNAVPQYRSPNCGRWSQLEAAVRRIAADADAVYVISGPLFESAELERIGPGGVAVPTHTFKVVLVIRGSDKTMYAAIVPNTPRVTEPLNQFTTTVHEVERRSGLDFFPGLDDEEEQQLESAPHNFPLRER